MNERQPDLQLTYEPGKGWVHFVLYVEAEHGLVGAGLNAAVSIQARTPYVREWVGRLRRCEPNALHTTLVENRKIPDLFHPCVYDDKDSPSAVAGAGCVCRQTFTDPEFGLPVVAEHYRTVDGRIETWTYLTYAPLDLRPGDAFGSLIVDGGGRLFWIRTAGGLLSLLPERRDRGYTVGYSGNGPAELARYIQQLLDSNGCDTAAYGRRGTGFGPHLREWVTSEAAKATRELTLDDLRRISQGP